MNADGSGQTQLTNTPTADEFFPAWSANGQKLVFTTDATQGSTRSTWSMPTDRTSIE